MSKFHNFPCVEKAQDETRQQMFRGNTVGQAGGAFQYSNNIQTDIDSDFDLEAELQLARKQRKEAGIIKK